MNMALELTEREIAIARGEDPDAKQAPASDEAADQVEGEDTELETEEELEAEGESGKDAVKGAKEGASPEAKKAKAKSKKEEVEAELEDEDEEDSEEDEEEEEAEKPEPKAKSKSKSKAKAKSEDDEVEIDPSEYEAEGYDEKTMKLVKHAKKLEEKLKNMEASVAEVQKIEAARQHQRHLDDFHDAIDTLPKSLVGRSVDENDNPVKLTGKAAENREAIWEKAKELYNTQVKKAFKKAEKSGTDPEVPDLRKVAKDAAQIILADQIREADRKEIRRDLVEQSKKRRPVAGGSARREFVPGGQRYQEADPVKAIANDPRLVKFWEKAQEENGSK